MLKFYLNIIRSAVSDQNINSCQFEHSISCRLYILMWECVGSHFVFLLCTFYQVLSALEHERAKYLSQDHICSLRLGSTKTTSSEWCQQVNEWLNDCWLVGCLVNNETVKRCEHSFGTGFKRIGCVGEKTEEQTFVNSQLKRIRNKRSCNYSNGPKTNKPRKSQSVETSKV